MNEVWLNSDRLVATLHYDGNVTYAEDATEEELKAAIKLLLHQIELDRVKRLDMGR